MSEQKNYVLPTPIIDCQEEQTVKALAVRYGQMQNPNLLRVQKRRLSSAGGVRTFWESGFGKPVKKSIKDAEKVSL